MKELFDYLTQEDKNFLTDYIRAYGYVDNADLSKVLKYWNKNKKTMFRALGKQLRVKVPVDIEVDSKAVENRLKKIYSIPFSSSQERGSHCQFIVRLSAYLEKCIPMSRLWPYISDIQDMFAYENIERGYFNKNLTLPTWNKDKDYHISAGSKTIKSIRKWLQSILFFNYGDWYETMFESWRNAISNVTTSKRIKGNLVFAIHPVDFVTMSHNNCDWTSCLSWQDGSYSGGTIEMMNSNMTILAYLESNKDFQWNEYTIPNKSWRSIFYVNKYILLSGKSYPYYNKNLTRTALDLLEKLLDKNLNMKYHYHNQKYYDMRQSEYTNSFLRTTSLSNACYENPDKKNQKILIYTNGMYNDLAADPFYEYWCSRNHVEKTIKINASGLQSCLCCGEPIETQSQCNRYHDDALESRGEVGVCAECFYDRYCDNCHFVKTNPIKLFSINVMQPQFYSSRVGHVCEECITEYFFIRSKRMFIHSDDIHLIKGCHTSDDVVRCSIDFIEKELKLVPISDSVQVE